MAYIYGRNDLFFCAKQTSYGAIRHTDGTASLAATDACKHRRVTLTPNRARLNPLNKETNSGQVFIDHSRQGRISGAASVELDLFSGSGAGVQPDNGCILESAFGAVTENAGTNVTYTRTKDSFVPVELWGLNTAGKRGACAFGSIVNRLTLSGGQDFATLSADFINYAVIGQDRFADALTAEKGGLTAWPTVPATQSYTGSELAGFTIQLTLDGTAYSVRDFTVTMNMNRQYDVNHCAIDGTEYFPQTPFEGMSEFLLACSFWSTDDASIGTLLNKIAKRTAFDATLVIGAVAGGTYTLPMKRLILPPEVTTDGFEHQDVDDRKAITIPTLRMQASAASAADEIGPLVIT